MALTQLVAAHAAAAAAGAGKKAAQVQLQADLCTDEDWAKFLNRDGLLVVDVYTGWCGPCIGMVANLKKIKVELGGDNLHLAIARADSIEVLRRFRNRSEPTWMFIAAGRLVQVVRGADAPRLARTIQQELRHEELARRGERDRPATLPHQLTPEEQLAADAEEARLREKRAREQAAVLEKRTARREARARRLEAHFQDVCPVLMLPHAQKYLRKVSDALEPHGAIVADKCPVLVGAEGARVLGAEDEALGAPGARAALTERPALTLLIKKLPDREGDVIEMCRRALCGDPDEGRAGRSLLQELSADGVPGLFVPADRHARAVALDLLYPKMVCGVVEPPPPPEPPHVAMLFGAWQRRAVLSAAALPALAPLVLRYGFFADDNVEEPRLLCKTLDQYEDRTEKDYSETVALMVAVGPADPALDPAGGGAVGSPPAQLVSLGPLHVSEDVVAGAVECARLFPHGYSEPERKSKPKAKKKKKKRESKEDALDEGSMERAAGAGAAGGDTPDPGGDADAGEGTEDAGEGADGEPDEEEGEAHADKATSPPPPQTPL